MSNLRWIGAALAVLVSSLAFGQEAKPIGALVRVGNFYPSDLQARNAGKTWTLFGIQFDIGKKRPASNLAISVDGYSKGDLTAIPVLLNQVTTSKTMTYSIGIGASFNREARNTQAGLKKTNRTEFAYQAGVGFDLAKYKVPGMLEFRYLGNGYSTLSGFAVCLGLRF